MCTLQSRHYRVHFKSVTNNRCAPHVGAQEKSGGTSTPLPPLANCFRRHWRIRRLGLKAACRLHRTRPCLHVRRYRGRRSGRPRRPSPVLRDAGNGASVIIGSRTASRGDVARPPRPRRPVHRQVHVDRMDERK